MIELRVLGAIDVRADRPGGAQNVLTQPKRLALLLYLALAEPRGLHSRERLMALLWPEADDASSRHSLRNALHALRSALGDDAIVTRGEAYVGLDFDLFSCDALEVRAHLAEGRIDDAVALWTGELAPGFHVSNAPDFERWLDAQRDALRRALRSAAWKQARELQGSGQAELYAVRRAVRLDPGDEPGARRLMRLLADAGDRGGVLRAYQDLADHFARERDSEPSAETRALVAQLRSSGATVRAPFTPPIFAPVVQPVPSVERQSAQAAPTTKLRPSARHRRLVALGAVAAAVLAVLAFRNGSLFFRPRLSPAVTPEVQAKRAVLRLPDKYRADTAAYSSYLRGLTLRFRFRFLESRDTLAALVDRRPQYVPGLYGLGHTYAFIALYDLADPDETWAKINSLARRAIAFDSTAASAWLLLAAEAQFRRLDVVHADEHLARARTLDSLDNDVAGLRSVWFRFFGQMDSAVAYARLAHQLDPLASLHSRLLGRQLYLARRYEESREMFEDIMREDPGWENAYTEIAEVYRAMGRPREAVKWFRRAREAKRDSLGAAALHAAASDSEALRLLAADARRTITQLDSEVRAGDRAQVWPYATAYAAVRDTLATLAWLDSMLVRHDGFYSHQVRLDPLFDFLRGDARYQTWEARSGLPPLVRTGT